MSIDATIDDAFKSISSAIELIVFWGPEIAGVTVPLVVAWLALGALFFSVYLGFPNIRYARHAFKCLGNEYEEPDARGQTTNFQSLAACLSATIGLGNIAGVAVAITLGGPGAAFWMLMLGIFGMGSKFSEVMLGHKYRQFPDPERPDEVSGGPMYYLKEAFARHNLPKVGVAIAALFAVTCIGGALGGGNMFQSNQVYQQVVYATGGEESFFADKGWLFGLILAGLAGLVTLGGVKSIASVAAKLTPIMAILYTACGLIVLAVNYEHIPSGIATIFSSAFSLEAGWGGFVGAIIAGVKRAAFSNEAGLGTAAIIQASAKTEFPVRQGLVGGLGPFFDTVIVCMVTALVIVISGVYQQGQGVSGIDLTSRAFETVLPWFDFALMICVILFAFSTIIVYSYYGEKCLGYLVGDRKAVAIGFRVFYLVFVVMGSAATLDSVISFADAMFLSMAVPNLIGLYLLAPEIKRDLTEYVVLMGEKKGKISSE
ncbi:MAG TPA: alanine/glycine:cation symporter family protein [Alphaproteobacteria bacterium]|nr:alanine/glycine:cation symporter family protein [Alphaproteobacteria bacterium]HNS45171.1 alanine/glycine:cation symporter family protein [Alphaproteobacteria bacterium]